MVNSCSTQGCLSDKAFAIVDNKKKTIHRISFSKNLLEHIIKDNNELLIREITFKLGKELKKDETSSTGLYAIVKSKNNWTLRISLFKNIANYLCDFETRKLRECIITKIH